MTVAFDRKSPSAEHGGPPGSWWPAHRLARRALGPVERFLSVEAASGVVLLIAASIALFWANSPWRESYHSLWHAPVGVRLGPFWFERDVHFLINDGVMTLFFFVVGLEIRREIHRGELSEPRRAALPLAAAIGGMLAPALLFFALNRGHGGAAGWGIPMATDIAFAVGMLPLLGRRLPASLRVLLLALAVIDDVGAIVVIALFYSSGIAPLGLLVLGVGLAGIVAMQLFGLRSPWAYVPAGLVVWAGAHAAGVHPTLAGVVVGLMTPVRAWWGPRVFVERADVSVAAIRQHDGLDERAVHAHLERLNEARREAVSPLERIERALHRWVAFGAMPLFALANAGVSMGDASLRGESWLVLVGVSAGLVLGKPAGIVAVSWLSTRLGLAVLPKGVTWPQLAIVGVVAGIGFTMSLFIAQLAFAPGVNLQAAKVGIVIGSGVSALLASVLGRVVLSSRPHPSAQGRGEAAAPPHSAEAGA